MFAIYKRELKSYYHSFIGFLFTAVLLFFIGLYFSLYNMVTGYPYFSYVVSSVEFVLLISMPILTMRSMAEEKKSKTDQLILTAPVSVGGIVVGKFLALVTVFAVPVLVMCVYPLIMTFFGSVPMGEAYMSILGFLLYGSTCIAIGLFLSSLTESQIIAAVLSFVVLFAGYMMTGFCNLISETGNFLTMILSCFDLYTPFSNLLIGTLNIGSIVYYLSLIALFLFFTVQSVQKRRYSMSVKNFSFGAYSTGSIVVMTAVVVLINVLVAELPTTWTVWDLSSQKLYSVTDRTKEYLATVDEDVSIYVIVAEDSQDTTLGQLLQNYEALSEHITVEYIDPSVNPRFHTQYTDESITINSLIVVSDKRSKVINYNDVYETSFDYSTFTSSTTGFDGEGQITSALDYVLSDDMPKLYVLDGHGEYGLDTSFTTAIEKENVVTETITLMNYDEVPEDGACLLINSPIKDFSSDDADKIISYLDKGGKVVFVTAYTEEELPNQEKVLDYMGISQAEGLIAEGNTSYYYRSPFYLLPEVNYSVYTNGIYGSYYIFSPYTKGLIVDETREDITYDSFLTTSDAAFSKVDISNMESVTMTEEDVAGPFAVGVEAVKTVNAGEDDETEATMVVISGEQIFTESADQMVSGANLLLFTNTIGQFAEHEVSVSIPVKSYDVSMLTVSRTYSLIAVVVTIAVLPIGCLAAGFVIWFRRRKR